MIIITTLRSHNKEISLVLSIAVCVLLSVSGLQMFRTVIDYVKKISGDAQLKSVQLSPLIKVCGISTLVQITASFCTEAGENAVGKIVELCGGVAAVCAMLPLLDSVLNLIKNLLGG